ncbi:hypothetical protein [Litoreibacter arenae]|uniref:Uncharacterized protein n=1 Tax=Litoreibacter arenae DSM 19593 TaxID=1123360 RepID=S9QHB1_9RHOB|nr:hypothetical protein [Litoreibacter arenae]EPX80856.1 hypothetical protein thalar_01078 [Litoreibacter arenae DSM 19593]
MGNEHVSTRWKEVDGIHYSMLQAPTSAAYVPGEDIKFFGDYDYNPKGPTGADSNTKFGMAPRGKRINRQIAPLRNPFAKPPVPKASLQRRVGVGGGISAAKGEVLLMGMSRVHLMSINHKLWKAIENMKGNVAAGIKEHGGVLIVGRVSMMPTPNPETGMRQAFFYDAYIKDGAKSIDDLYRPDVKSDSRRAFVGPQPWDGHIKTKPASIGAAKYGPPKPWVPPARYMVLGEFLVFATNVGNQRR